ncbi:hypothetical protein BD413DRAFT_492187 [Trametes elegans]|nr:hypothetical protein BD413DRAFT_492187 [Trametes elegans]
MFSTKLVAALVTLLAAAATASAADASKIIRPVRNDEWYIGEQAIVEWDPTELPDTTIGVDIRLGYQYANSHDQHWDESPPLATNVPLLDGAAVVTVPNVEPKGVYMVQVGGSPEYTSPKFLIKPARN